MKLKTIYLIAYTLPLILYVGLYLIEIFFVLFGIRINLSNSIIWYILFSILILPSIIFLQFSIKSIVKDRLEYIKKIGILTILLLVCFGIIKIIQIISKNYINQMGPVSSNGIGITITFGSVTHLMDPLVGLLIILSFIVISSSIIYFLIEK